MYDITTKNVQSVMDKLKEISTANNEIDINDIFGRFTLDTFAEIAFGVKFSVNITSIYFLQFTHTLSSSNGIRSTSDRSKLIRRNTNSV